MARLQRTKKAPGYTKTITVGMRPEVWKALKLAAVHQDETLQTLVDRLVCTGLERPDLLRASDPMTSAN